MVLIGAIVRIDNSQVLVSISSSEISTYLARDPFIGIEDLEFQRESTEPIPSNSMRGVQWMDNGRNPCKKRYDRTDYMEKGR